MIILGFVFLVNFKGFHKFGIFPQTMRPHSGVLTVGVKFSIKWLLWNLDMCFDCGGSQKVCGAVLGRGFFPVNFRKKWLFWNLEMHLDKSHFVLKFTGEMPNAPDTTLIKHWALTLTIRTPQCGHTVWGISSHKNGKTPEWTDSIDIQPRLLRLHKNSHSSA